MYKPTIFFDDTTKCNFSNIINKNYYQKSKFSDCEIISNGFILPAKKNFDENGTLYFKGGVVDAKLNFVMNSQFLRSIKDGSLTSSYEFSTKCAKTIDKDVLYAGILINHFGHFLVEGMTRLWYWCENRDKNLDIAFLMPKNQKIFSQFKEFMDLLGIDMNKVHIIKKITKFKNIYVPKQSHIIDTSYNEKFIIPYRYISSLLPQKNKEKYYISRRKFKSGTLCMGEYLFEKLYSENGFKIIYPEKLTLKEQIIIMKNASEIAGINGSGMHMALFANDNIDITILERTDTPVAEQSIINQALNTKAYHVGVNVNPFPIDHSVGPTILTINDPMAEYCNVKNFKFNKKLLNYVKPSDGKKFIKLWLRYYSQVDNNNALAKEYPLVAKRFIMLSKTFTPLKIRIKQKIKNIKKLRSYNDEKKI